MDLVIPEPSCLILVGIAGCGKSTFAGRHFAASEVLSSDLCRELVADDPTDQSATGDAFSVLRFVLDRRLKRGRLTVVDATSLDRSARRPYLTLARKWGVPPVAVVLDLPFEVCRARDDQRTRAQVGEEVQRRQHADLQRGLRQLDREGYVDVHRFADPDELAVAEVVRVPWEPATALGC